MSVIFKSNLSDATEGFMRESMIGVLLAILAFALFFIGTGNAHAATYYVSPSGSDSSSGSSSSPFNTIQKAAGIVNPSDIVIVRDGTYTDTNGDKRVANLNRGGKSGARITFRAENKWGAVIDCQNVKSSYGMLIGSVGYIDIEDFEIKNCTAQAVMNNSGGDYITVYRNKLHHNNVSIYTGTGTSYTLIDSNVIYDNHDDGVSDPALPQAHGVYLRGTDNATVINNIFYDFNEDGWPIHAYGTYVTNSKIINNTFSGHNAKNGHILLSNTLTNLVIENNISYDPNAVFLRYASPAATNVSIRNNLVYPASLIDGAGCSASGFTCSGNITGQNPAFVNISAKDFHLQAGSPAIRNGDATFAPPVDHDNKKRPEEGYCDIGAYEH